ncbi:MAG: glycosyltransferase family 2 protein [Candidatus Levybacteria bacterium]|nr:glycosyltransferase family 2 protein [Candidatus Levybacteria bacterium]
MTDLSIIIVSYNTREFLKKCLDAIYASDMQTFLYEVIVVDNASSDNSLGMVREHFKDVIVIENKENVGFSTANNKGIQKSRGRYILFLNSDAIVEKNTLSAMVKFMEEIKDAGAATCKVELVSGGLDDAAHRGFPTPWNAFAHFTGLSKIFTKTKLFSGYNLTWMDLDKTHQIDALAGAFMMVRREAGEQVGWWDEDYFFYGEDIDFCYRLKAENWKIYYVPGVRVFHYKGVSGGIKKHSQHISTADKDTKRRVTIARFDAMRIFYRKHYENKYPRVITWLVLRAIDLRRWLTLKSL